MSYTDWKMEQNDEFVRKMNQEMANGMNLGRANNGMHMNYDNMNQRSMNSAINPYENVPYRNQPYMYGNPQMYNNSQMYNPYFQNPWMWQGDNLSMYDQREIERRVEKDLDYIIEMYPKTARLIQDLIKEECDNMDYEGSIMYDEYPDRVMLKNICARVHQQYDEMQSSNSVTRENIEENNELVEGQEVEANNARGGCSGNCRNNNQSAVDDLIEVLLFNEMHRRRCRNNRCRHNRRMSGYR